MAIRIAFIDATDNTLTFRIEGATPIPTSRAVYWTMGSQNLTTYIDANSTLSGSAKFINLTPGTSYTVACSVTGNYPWSSTRTESTTGTPPVTRPSNWYWSQVENNAFTGKGKTSFISYTRWNEFVDKVQDMYCWYHNNPNAINLSSAKMNEYDKVMTARRFNMVKNAIGSMRSTGISDKYPGDIVYGSYFITLSDRLNSVSK